ncbi:MAG: glycosyltransferase family protein [Chloroflexi bacterium]|nr:glycosyltransferase family protein [Chloroflexota bacterium]
MKNKTVAIIQGRMGSSRLPGKVLLDIAGRPMIQHVIERTRRVHALDTVVVATSNDHSDDPIADFCASLNVPCTRGSLHDVLDRYYQTAKTQEATVVVRITADCPMIDPDLIGETISLVTDPVSSKIQLATMQRVDFAANRLPPPFQRTYPIGLDVEVCSFATLQRAWQESAETFHREHVMPYIYENVRLIPSSGHISTGISSHGFHIALLDHDPDHGSLRWTVDTPEDLVFVREIFARLKNKPDFNWQNVLEILEKEPELTRINSDIRHKTMTEVDERANK